MRRELAPSLRREIEWAIGLLVAAGSPSSSSLETIHRAIRAESPMLAKRFQLFVDNCAPYEISREESNRLGTLLLALESWAQGFPWRLYHPGEFDLTDTVRRGPQSEVIQIRCTPTFKARLRAYCERSNTEASSVIRKAVEAYLADNPLWGPGDEEDEIESPSTAT